jgi:2-succinyl-5-enolpyruvyl-6-hydroxy-3-cyclohexene-1-carboxylate synthase
MKMADDNRLTLVAEFVAGLHDAGVRDVCISPGSRSTPLAIAVLRQPGLRAFVLADERSAAYFALGRALASGLPVALVCTSGTAPAHYLPALIEAFEARVPLIALTADRPPELREVGGNQTVRQVRMYGEHVKWAIELPVPGDYPHAVAHARATAARAVMHARLSPAGPVHVNVPLREPLLPERSPVLQGRTPRVHVGRRHLDESGRAALSAALERSRRTLIVAGQMSAHVAKQVVRFAEHIGAPILPDPTSQLRSLGGAKRAVVIDRADAIARALAAITGDSTSAWDATQARPDVIVRVGRALASKAIGQLLTGFSSVRQVAVDEDAWSDPWFSASDLFVADPAQIFADLCTVLARRGDHTYAEFWAQLNDRAERERLAVLADLGTRGAIALEGAVAAEVGSSMPADAQLVVGSSMPIRDLDLFFTGGRRPFTIFANRGASGIDGVVSTALGIAAQGKPTVLLLGDLSFYHDANALLASKLYGIPLTVVLVNNDGGGIFSFLPPAGEMDVFHAFEARHGLDFAPLVQAYGGHFKVVASAQDLRDELEASVMAAGLQVIEVRTDKQANVSLHKQIVRRLQDALAPLLVGQGG